VTDTNGLDILIAWAVFTALLLVLGALVLRGRADPIDEANRNTDGSQVEKDSPAKKDSQTETR
jgi:hypothetical protein